MANVKWTDDVAFPILTGGADTDYWMALRASANGKITRAQALDGFVWSNTQLQVKDQGGSFKLGIKPGETLTADRVFSIVTGDSARTLTLSGDAIIDNWFDQSVKIADTVQFVKTNYSSASPVDVTGAGAIAIWASVGANTITIGGVTSTVKAANDLIVDGDLTVNGDLATLNVTTLTIDDPNIELNDVTTPTDVNADGGGLTLKGDTNKTWNWVDATDAWTSSEHIDLATGKEFKINNVSVLSATTLGSAVVNASLTTITAASNFTLSQNSVNVITSEATGAVVNTLYLKAGDVGIGTVSQGLKLSVKGTWGYPATSGTSQTGITRFETSGNNVVIDFGTADSSPWGGWIQATNKADLGNEYPLILNPNGGNVGINVVDPDSTLEVNGTIHATNLDGGAIDAYVNASGQIIRQPSDKKFKINVKPLINALPTILQFNPIRHMWTIDSKMDVDKESYSLIAQELELIDPNLISKGDEYMSVKYGHDLSTFMIAGMQEHYAITDSNKSRIEILESKIAKLQTEIYQLKVSR